MSDRGAVHFVRKNLRWGRIRAIRFCAKHIFEKGSDSWSQVFFSIRNEETNFAFLNPTIAKYIPKDGRQFFIDVAWYLNVPRLVVVLRLIPTGGD